MSDVKNREAWLTDVAHAVEPLFDGFAVAPYRVTCGWPASGGLTGRVLGECHGVKSSAGGVHELFISPRLDKPLEVAGVLVHEMAHVVAGVDARHGAGFLRICGHVGLTKGKPRSRMPGTALDAHLSKIIEAHGVYPHQSLKPAVKVVARRLSQVKLVCVCGCTCRMSAKWLEEAGFPTCGCGGEMGMASE